MIWARMNKPKWKVSTMFIDAIHIHAEKKNLDMFAQGAQNLTICGFNSFNLATSSSYS